MKSIQIEKELSVLRKCNICPRNCGANRFDGPYGYCNSGSDFNISAIIVHEGEEPVISGKNGICNIFFSHCNLQCNYCQNYQISNNKCSNSGNKSDLNVIINKIVCILDTGIENVGFVSPSHMVPQVKVIIKSLNHEGYHPTIVYNSNAYDKVETLRSLENLVDVYLPDLKYDDQKISEEWSDSKNYPVIARKAIKEMYRQKGNILQINKTGKAEKGLIIRHLVLPGAVQNSKNVLRFISNELSNRIAVSVMSQYNPNSNVSAVPILNRKIFKKEYSEVINELNKLGFTKGWIQQLNSSDYFNPDFNSETPFNKPAGG